MNQSVAEVKSNLRYATDCFSCFKVTLERDIEQAPDTEK